MTSWGHLRGETVRKKIAAGQRAGDVIQTGAPFFAFFVRYGTIVLKVCFRRWVMHWYRPNFLKHKKTLHFTSTC